MKQTASLNFIDYLKYSTAVSLENKITVVLMCTSSCMRRPKMITVTVITTNG